MAEFAASIIAFIQLTDTVIRVCSHVIGNVRDAPRDMVIITSEVTSLRAILSCLHQDDLHPSTAEALPTLFAPSGPIQACYKSITALERLLPKVPDDASARNMSFNLVSLSWALKESQVRKLLAEITLHKSTLLLALTGDSMREIRDIKAGVGRLEQALSKFEQNEVLGWLDSKCRNPSIIHNGILEHREDHTGEWLCKWKKWNTWLHSEKPPEDRFLWIHGIPGAGKSVLASVAIESIKSHCKGTNTNRKLGYAYYYCHYSHNEDSGPPFLRWIINALCRQADWVPRELKGIRDSGHEPTVTELLTILNLILEHFDCVYLAVDGVDESKPRTHILSVLATFATHEHFQKVRILSTSRLHQDIEQSFSGISTSISMSNALVYRDIQTVVHKWITNSPRMRRWNHLSKSIEERLCERAHGMFRWVACQMQTLERIREESQLVRALNSLPQDLDEVYVRLLGDVPEADRPFVRRVLLWIAGHASSRRLRDEGIHIDALVSAVCDDLRHSTGATYRYTAEDVRELCGCLITVQEHELPFTDFLTELHMTQEANGEYIAYKKNDPGCAYPPPTGDFVTLAHYTVMEFLVSDRILGSPAQWCSMSPAYMADEFFRSILRQSLAADPTGTSADWVRDREPYCLTLVPLVIQHMDFRSPKILDLCVRYFLPTSPHYPRLRQIQAHLITGCRDARSFYVARLPVHDPKISLSEYQQNDPNVWAIMGMLASYNTELALEFMQSSLGCSDSNYENLGKRPLLVSFLEEMSEAEYAPAHFQTHEATLEAAALWRCGREAGGIFHPATTRWPKLLQRADPPREFLPARRDC